MIDNEYAEKDVSLIELFEQAHKLRSVTDSNPLVVASVYRLLLVILYRALQLPDDVDEWLSLYESGKFPIAVTDYLYRFEGRFDLFSEEYPFLQSSGFQKKAMANVKKLSMELATANNKTLFSHNSDDDSCQFHPSQTARYLLMFYFFDFGGTGGGGHSFHEKATNYFQTPLIKGLICYLSGKSIFETLMLNLRPLSAKDTCESDRPIWELDALFGVGEREPEGMLEYLTYKNRHIRLLPNDGGFVSNVMIGQAYTLPKQSIYWEKEPTFAYRLDNNGDINPLDVDFERSFWRDSSSIYFRTTIDDVGAKRDLRPVCFRWVAELIDYKEVFQSNVYCMVFGIDNKKANPLAWMCELLPINVALLEESHVSDTFNRGMGISQKISSKIYWALYEYSSSLMPSTPGEDEKKRDKRLKKTVAEISRESNYWSELGLKYHDFLRNITKNEMDAYQVWLKACINAAKRNLDATLDNQLGRTTKELKAKSLAQHKLNILLAPFKKELPDEE